MDTSEMSRYKHRRRKRGANRIRAMALRLFLAVVYTLTIAAAYTLAADGLAFDFGSDTGASRPVAGLENGWNLILVNREHYIPEDYEVELAELSNGEQVDTRIYPELQKMLDAAREDGLSLFVAAGYRTQNMQLRLLEEKKAAYQSEGYSKAESKRLAEQWVAIPGTSEHQLGIAVDINADTSKCSSSEVYGWLEENACQYGFIRRYPPDKTEITGVINEPWHYRYVGKEAAWEINAQGICLEEYLS